MRIVFSVVIFNILINVYVDVWMVEGVLWIYCFMYSKGYLFNIVMYNIIIKMWCNGYDI